MEYYLAVYTLIYFIILYFVCRYDKYIMNKLNEKLEQVKEHEKKVGDWGIAMYKDKVVIMVVTLIVFSAIIFGSFMGYRTYKLPMKLY